MILHSKENLENLIILILAEYPNISAVRINNFLIKSGKKYTIQAIYKELRKLQEGGVVVKVEKKYSLRLPWAIDFISLAGTINDTHIKSMQMKDILPDMNKKEIWHFDDLLKLNDFWSHLLLLLVNSSKNKILLGWNPHTWFHLIQTEQEEQYLKSLNLAKGELYLIIGSRNYLDRWAEKYFKNKIVEYSYSESVFEKERNVYYNVIDDFVLTVKIDKVTTEKIDSIYNEIKRAEDIDFNKIFNIFHKKVKAKIWLEKNPVKSKKIRSKFSSFFGVGF